MRKLYALALFSVSSYIASAQTTIYARFINYSSQVYKTDGSIASATGPISVNTITPTNGEFFQLTTYTQGVTQTLSIGSQSTGAGAGKITFNPFTFSKLTDGLSATLFSLAASGTPFKTVEIFFVDNNNNILAEQLYKLAAVKTVGWSSASCSSDCPAVIENVSMQYGGQVDVIYKAGTKTLTSPLIKGWNVVTNTADNSLTTTIQ